MGEGWGLAVINSLTELKSINENVQNLRDNITFLLGGTTNSGTGERLDYFDYQLTNSGKSNSTVLMHQLAFYHPY